MPAFRSIQLVGHLPRRQTRQNGDFASLRAEQRLHRTLRPHDFVISTTPLIERHGFIFLPAFARAGYAPKLVIVAPDVAPQWARVRWTLLNAH